MLVLFQALAKRVDAWRDAGYPSADYPAIAEILRFAVEDDSDGRLRFLRRAQLRALETYWYLRLVLATPKVPALYTELFPDPRARCEAMGLTHKDILEIMAFGGGIDAVIARMQSDDAFVRRYGLESLRETFSLDYPSYILALAMGAGKTILMGSIVATEFALALEYPDGPFVQNALVFAPGKTILGALRELADVPFERILPARLHKPFAASFKLTFTRDGDKTIPIVGGSRFNLVVTNSEKIRIQKPTVRNGAQLRLFTGTKAEEAEALANLRLQAIASLPNLAVFSDEAHHTYGPKLLGRWQKDPESGAAVFKADGIKRIRRTIDYLAEETDLLVVVNATGTPYFQRQPLRDVVVWYGLGEGIRDGVLKELAGGIKVFDFSDGESDRLVHDVVDDFLGVYGKVHLPNGAPARLALYFPSIEARDALRPAVESALVLHGLGTDTVLAVDNKSTEATRRNFEAVARDPAAPHRILLLVNMGTEGWNCPSLFACALVRKLTTSNNFVLQAATRCLRQVPGNSHPARVYLTGANRRTLEDQLAETYGTSLRDLDRERPERVEKTVVLHKPHLPPLLIRKRVLRVRARTEALAAPLVFTAPTEPAPPGPKVQTYSVIESQNGVTRFQRLDAGDEDTGFAVPPFSTYTVAAELAANHHVPTAEVLAALRACYGDEPIPAHHVEPLGVQIESLRADYETFEEEIDVAVALVKPEGFDLGISEQGAVYTARISFAKDREHLYVTAADTADPAHALAASFHYEGYNLDSMPEREFLDWVLELLRSNTHRIEGLWFTGGLTDPAKTDLLVEYLGDDGRWHNYSPDFVIRRADGKHLVVEVKRDTESPNITADLARLDRGEEPQTREGRKAVALKRWERLNPERLSYQVLFADTALKDTGKQAVRDFLLAPVPDTSETP
jgi:type III restriction enzyme